MPHIFQHQQQVAAAVERAKQVTMTELNAIIGVSTKVVGITTSVSRHSWLLEVTYFYSGVGMPPQ